jgi:glucose/arabinose dehydrogenase
MARHVSLLSLAVVFTSCTPVPSDPTCTLVEDGFGPVGNDDLTVEVIADGLTVPWSVAFVDDTTILVTEREGKLRVIENGVLRNEPVVDFTDVWAEAEAGLLGLALHPAFATNRLFYVYITIDDGTGPRNRIERFMLATDGRSAAFDRVILDNIPAFRVHDGGRLRFGPDDMLYVGTGDARSPDDSQNVLSLAGKILRITPEGTLPIDNPFTDAATFVTGLRNSQGFDWIDDDTLAVADHGPSGEVQGRTGHDEVNVARAGDNLGWPVRFACEEQAGFKAPVLTSVTAMPPGGLAVVRENAFAPWAGNIVTGTLGSKHLHRIVLDDEYTVEHHETYLLGDPPEGFGRLRDVVNGPDGLYVTTSNCDGRGTCPPERDRVLRIRPN